jgi:hypothetical protein
MAKTMIVARARDVGDEMTILPAGLAWKWRR